MSRKVSRSVSTTDICFLDSGQAYEYEIRSDGNYYHIIIGKHQYGNYIIIPNWNVGSELSCLSDHFWNEEHLCHSGMPPADSKRISIALKEISKTLSF